MLRDFFFHISFSAFQLKAENESISDGGTNGSILVGKLISVSDLSLNSEANF